jgi:hypothetical protein
MAINPNATATFIFAGLALSHFNKHSDKWELLFIRDDENLHNLKIIFDHQTPREKVLEVGLGEIISVEVTKPKSASGRYENGSFHRDPHTDDPQDFRWILDFSSRELHDHPVKVTKRKRDNFFSTPNAVFYNYLMSDKIYDLQKQKDGKDEGDPVPLAAIGDFTGAEIECEKEGSVSIKIEGDETSQIYEVTPQSKVFFNNICDEIVNPKCESDFKHYYDVISDNGETFELIRQKAKEHGLRSNQAACESGTVGAIVEPPPSLDGDKP